MRHLGGLAPIQVGLLARRMMDSAGVRLLVAAAGGAQRPAPAELGAHVSAVGMAVVAPPAHVENPAAATTTDEARVQKWRRRLESLQKRIAGGCHLTRDPSALIDSAGFAISGLETFYAQGPKVWSFLYRGVGTAR